MDFSEKRELNMIFNKSGSGSYSAKLSIPMDWCYRLGIEKDDRAVSVYYDDKLKQIIISKK